jgi:uncharacterized protein YukE
MSDIYVDVQFSHAAAAAALTALREAVRDTEMVLSKRAVDLKALHQGWEGYARDRYEEWCLAFDVVAAGILEALRQAAANVETQRHEAIEVQAYRVRCRQEIAEQQRREEAARVAAAETARRQVEELEAAAQATR